MARCESCGTSMSGSDLHDPFCETEIGNTRRMFEELQKGRAESDLEITRLESQINVLLAESKSDLYSTESQLKKLILERNVYKGALEAIVASGVLDIAHMTAEKALSNGKAAYGS